MTITEVVSFELIVKRSRFLAFLHPVTTKEQATQLLEHYRQQYWDAVHHCYAWRLGDNGMQFRMSDDGEPSGSAGKPILFALQRTRLTNVMAVVVRYFGGVKLGVGPLARAYADAVNGAIEIGALVPVIAQDHLLVHCMYDDVSKIIPLLDEVGATYQTAYSDAVSFDVLVPTVRVEYLKDQVVARTNARAGYSKVSTE
ncbi:MAG: YigZ family protein [Bradyrhizobiaceae bacterium]|nr:YigZ family protein [Bradyrhizobiaceae bacterium]